MKKLFALAALLLLTTNVQARELAGIVVPESVSLHQQTLKLNGCGLRKKLFLKIYLGALYTPRQISSLSEAVGDSGDKLIRMTFLYKKVEKEKIVVAFFEGFRKNSPELTGTAEMKQFLNLFTQDFLRGDVVDLELNGGGKVVARHNGRLLGEVNSKPLSAGILAIYLGDYPADNDLKSGMLGLKL